MDFYQWAQAVGSALAGIALLVVAFVLALLKLGGRLPGWWLVIVVGAGAVWLLWRSRRIW